MGMGGSESIRLFILLCYLLMNLLLLNQNHKNNKFKMVDESEKNSKILNFKQRLFAFFFFFFNLCYGNIYLKQIVIFKTANYIV